ncbi:toll-like receptor 13 [Centropristis striata]|uniref:toll-like receptor 13 n=1 Tax=Centropristis striata TaxID=184440 RepID=UPI0027E02EC3|nr:toll-like receptor 13 [Centropristis striata]XP_059210939.1 toll-like receptor 13 [Centropristis striata]
MQAKGQRSLFLISLLSFLVQYNPLLAFSLKNCTIVYSEDVTILWVKCDSRGLAAIPDDIPRNATILHLGSNQLLKIPRTALKHLSNLTTLNAEMNQISHIDDGAFADLGKLRTLDMDYNQLTSLTDNMFEGLSELVELTLDDNRISHISPAAFQSLVSLEVVCLNNNQLYQIRDIAPIVKLPTINDLLLANNNFTSFQSDDLPLNVSNLQVLKLSGNPLRRFSITADIFPRLRSLDFEDCSSDIEWDVANKTFLRSLTELSLGDFYVSFETYRAMLQTTDSLQQLSLSLIITEIDGLIEVACRIPSLRRLDITSSEISSVDDNLFRSCSQLTELVLYYTGLSKLSQHSLISMTRLRSLRLFGNRLHRVPIALRGLSTLERLDLSANVISDIDCLDFLNLTRLTFLDLTQNRISNLLGCAFQSLYNLKFLHLGENGLFTFDNTFKVNLRNLQILTLGNNGYFTLRPEDFRNLSSLQYLDLESDKPSTVYEWAFKGLDHLQALSLSIRHLEIEIFRGLTHLENLTLHFSSIWNQRSSLQNDEPPFSNLPNLKTLILRVHDADYPDVPPDLLKGLNSLEYFMSEKYFLKSLDQDLFKHTPKLKSLQIIHSNLSDLTPEVFWPIPNLQILDLSNNKFKSLDFLARAGLKALSWLKLSGNGLSVINETVFQSLPALKYLDLNHNSLTCECSNAGFIQWVQSNNQTQVVNGHQYTCAFPVSQQGNKFLDFDISSCWIDASFLCFICSSSLVVLTLLTCFIYHFLRWHLAYAYYLFLAFLYDKRRRRRDTPHCYDAFVSYNVHDEAWVYREMLPVLEGEQGWRLCLHHRDFEPGKPIVENITEAIYGSRKTICVISRHYLSSEWCSREIQMASFRLFDEHEDVLILLFMEDIPVHQMSLYHRMRGLIKRRTYLSWPQAGQHTGAFWQNIRRALETAGRPADHTRPNLIQ